MTQDTTIIPITEDLIYRRQRFYRHYTNLFTTEQSMAQAVWAVNTK